MIVGVTLAIPQNDTLGMISTEHEFFNRPTPVHQVNIF
jgi:hypothetical protein